MDDLRDIAFSQQPGQEGLRRFGVPVPLKGMPCTNSYSSTVRQSQYGTTIVIVATPNGTRDYALDVYAVKSQPAGKGTD